MLLSGNDSGQVVDTHTRLCYYLVLAVSTRPPDGVLLVPSALAEPTNTDGYWYTDWCLRHLASLLEL